MNKKGWTNDFALSIFTHCLNGSAREWYESLWIRDIDQNDWTTVWKCFISEYAHNYVDKSISSPLLVQGALKAHNFEANTVLVDQLQEEPEKSSSKANKKQGHMGDIHDKVTPKNMSFVQLPTDVLDANIS